MFLIGCFQELIDFRKFNLMSNMQVYTTKNWFQNLKYFTIKKGRMFVKLTNVKNII